MFYLYYVDLYNNMSMDEYHDVLPLLCRSMLSIFNNMSMDEYHDVLPLLCRSLQHEKASLSRGHSVVKYTNR